VGVKGFCCWLPSADASTDDGDCLQCELSGFRFFCLLACWRRPAEDEEKKTCMSWVQTIIHLESFFTFLIFIAIIIIFGCCAIWKK
jgi:hypothetical protein